MTSMEKSLKNQYLDASNINARIHLHELYSTNKKGWFPWIFEQCPFKKDMSILEIGCGDGSFWTTNEDKLPGHLSVTLTDISEGMLRDARRNLMSCSNRDFTYVVADAAHLPFADNRFDLILANHVLFYLDNPMDALKEIKRVLNPNGVLIASTYGEHHMEEVTSLTRGFVCGQFIPSFWKRKWSRDSIFLLSRRNMDRLRRFTVCHRGSSFDFLYFILPRKPKPVFGIALP